MSLRGRRCFYGTTRSFSVQIGSMFQFFLPTAAAAWTMRTQVVGVLAEAPQLSDTELWARFISGSGIPAGGQNLRHFGSGAWPSHLGRLAKTVLVEQCALFEGWLEATLPAVTGTVASKKIDGYKKGLQFSTEFDVKGMPQSGVRRILETLTASADSRIRADLVPSLRAHRHYAGDVLEELLVCYQAFKQARNAHIHAGGTIPKHAATRLAAYETVYADWQGNVRDLKTRMSQVSIGRLPAPPVRSGARAEPAFFDVVGFNVVLLRLVRTLDAELALGAHAKVELLRRWDAAWSQRVRLPKGSAHLSKALAFRFVAAGLAEPVNGRDMAQLLIEEGRAHKS